MPAKRIEYTAHLKTRLRLRHMASDLPRHVYLQSTERYYDVQEERMIAVAHVEHEGRIRPLSIAYDEFEDHVEIVTIHPIRQSQIDNRLQTGR